MKKFLLFIFVTLSLWQNFTDVISADSVDPIPPFSIEGNPPEDYYFSAIFPLFKFVRPRNLEIYENRTVKRDYEDLWVCPGKGFDRRDDYCNNQGDTCEGGEVDLCKRNTLEHARTAHSSNGSCQLDSKPKLKNGQKDDSELIDGHCDYRQRPAISNKVKGTDFSLGDLDFPKIQNKSNAYSYIGSDDNPITHGSNYLNSDSCEIYIRKLVVVRRAKQTKNTVHLTGEWPLGWVDWGYQDKNMTKTLLEINEAMPDSIAGLMPKILDGVDSFYLTGGKIDELKDYSGAKKRACEIMSDAMGKSDPPEWAKDIMSVPMYSPSWRQGYVRPSICVWDICCPGTRCKTEPTGIKRALYYDDTISQAYGGALDTFLMQYPLEEGAKIFNKIAGVNQLIRFASTASEKAIPSEIMRKLNEETKDSCTKYIPWGSFLSFGTHIDYLDPGEFLGPNKTCPEYKIYDAPTKENAKAFNLSPLEALIAMLWGNAKDKSTSIDQVDSVVYHLITVPDAMSQLIQEIQQPSYDIRDTLADLEIVKEYNSKLGNTIDDSGSGLLGGQSSLAANAKRFLELYGCSDEMYSSYTISIEAYATGSRDGCNKKTDSTTTASGKCNGIKFASIIADSPWKTPTDAATTVVLNSAMFVGGVLNPKLEEVYAKAEAETGVPCEVLAGIHFEEGSSNFTDSHDPETVSVQNGGAASRDGGLQTSAINAAKTIKKYPITNTAKLIASMSNFNGGGNANCQKINGITIPYSGCPRQFIGEDDPYATHMLDAKHMNMYQIYCDDFITCNPFPKYDSERPGSFAVALAVYAATSKNAPPGTVTPPTNTTGTPIAGAPSTGSSLNPTGDCGAGYIDTALGCLPYERTEFVMAALRFLIGISGGIALMIMLIASIQIMTAAGDTKKIQSGRDLFTSAVVGLLFLIFSVSLARIFGADILKIPGFGR